MKREPFSTTPITEWDMETFTIEELFRAHAATGWAFPVSGDLIAAMRK